MEFFLWNRVIILNPNIERVAYEIIFNRMLNEKLHNMFLFDGKEHYIKFNALVNDSESKKLSETLNGIDIPCINYSISSLLENFDLDQMLTSLLEKNNGDYEISRKSVVIIDEFDKIAIKVDSTSRNETNDNNVLYDSFMQNQNKFQIQKELIKFLSGETIKVNYKGLEYNFDTSCLTVICMGNFKVERGDLNEYLSLFNRELLSHFDPFFSSFEPNKVLAKKTNMFRKRA